jgi:hypothetical protein
MLTIFEDRRNTTVPLQLQFRNSPEMEGRNQHIKKFYWKL